MRMDAKRKVLEELIGDFETVLLLDLVLGELIEEPHALVGPGGQGQCDTAG